MNQNTEIGILLISKIDDIPMGLVVLDSSGLMIYQILQKQLHFYAMKPIERYFNNVHKGEPLHMKYAEQITTMGKIPDDTLWSEATTISVEMNLHGVSVAGKSVKAKPVHFRSDRSKGTRTIIDE